MDGVGEVQYARTHIPGSPGFKEYIDQVWGKGILLQTLVHGDGMLATFDLPGRAVACARTLGSSLESIGLPIRSGIHTGELELRGDDVSGIAVHLAARIPALLGPAEVLVPRRFSVSG